MLKLNEKLIRKGKPVGLPYIGSKKKISKKIIEIIKQNFDIEGKIVYDIFGGGGAITCECLINEIPVVYNDHDLSVGKMFKRVLNCDRDYIKSLVVSREEFSNIRNKKDKTTTDELKLLINSFGNDRTYYLYSKELSDIKSNLAKDILKDIDDFNYKKSKIYLDFIRNTDYNIGQIEQISRLSQLDNINSTLKVEEVRLQQIERLSQIDNINCLIKDGKFKNIQQLNHNEQLNRESNTKIKYLKYMKNRDYTYFSNIKNQILYLDPPYENPDRVLYKDHKNFSHKDFYDWVVDMSKNNIVLLSSYNVSDDRFKVVFEFKSATSTKSANGKEMSNGNYEKLYMVK